jgi:DNA helicase-2/ATP-dependent DNA helicase PcrA
LDNGGWNNYNFQGLFEGAGTEIILGRTRKIFYVCCTRAKENLAVFFSQPSILAINNAKELFGSSNIIEIT